MKMSPYGSRPRCRGALLTAGQRAFAIIEATIREPLPLIAARRKYQQLCGPRTSGIFAGAGGQIFRSHCPREE